MRRAIADSERGIAKRGVVLESQVVVPVHVVPVLHHLSVGGTVDLHDEPGFLPDGVEPSPLAVSVAPGHLAIRRRDPERPDHAVEEVKLGQGVRASGDITDGGEHELAPLDSGVPLQYRSQLRGKG